MVLSSMVRRSRARTRARLARQRARQRQTRCRPASGRSTLPWASPTWPLLAAAAERPARKPAPSRASRSRTRFDGGAKPLRVFCSYTHTAVRACATKSRAACIHAGLFGATLPLTSSSVAAGSPSCQRRTRACNASAFGAGSVERVPPRCARKHAASAVSPAVSCETATAMYRVRALKDPSRSARRARHAADWANRTSRRTAAAAAVSSARRARSRSSAADITAGNGLSLLVAHVNGHQQYATEAGSWCHKFQSSTWLVLTIDKHLVRGPHTHSEP